MSSYDVTYEFVKGQGWVPKQKPKSAKLSPLFGDELVMDYINYQPHADNAYAVYGGHGRGIRTRRQRDLTYDQFVNTLETRRDGGDRIIYRYVCQDGTRVEWLIQLDRPYNYHNGEYDYTQLQIQRSLHSLYQQIRARGF